MMMKEAVYGDKKRVVGILSQAFDDNQSVNHVVLQDRWRRQRIRALMAYSFDVCMEAGKVFLSEDGQACALILLPEKKRFFLRRLLLDFRLVIQCTGWRRLLPTLRREAAIRRWQPKEPMIYLWFIGVQPGRQRQGAGTRLIGQLLAFARTENKAIYLETSTKQNLPWYQGLGFRQYHRLELPYTLYFLKTDRKP